MGEACNTGSESTAYIGIDKSHLGCLIVILVMHIVNQVQYIYIDISKPVKPEIVLLNHFIVIKVLACDALHLRTYLDAVLLVETAVDRVKEGLTKICTRTEELDFLTGLGSGYTAADGVIITPYRLHNVIVLILDRARFDGDVGSVLLELLRKIAGVENRKVRFRRRTHVLKCMQETVIRLCNHMTAIHTDTTNLKGSPGRVTGEELVVGRDTCELNHAEFHRHMVDDLLCLGFCQHAVFQVALKVDIKEGGDTSHGHRCTVLCLNRCKVAEIQPLASFLCVLCRLGDIVTINLSHLLHAL